MRALAISILTLAVAAAALPAPGQVARADGTVRIATFNASMFRPKAGQLAAELGDGESAHIQAVAAILQRVRPDIVLINEFDFDRASAGAFAKNYLEVGQGGGLSPIAYAHRFIAPSNTGVATGFDLDNNGEVGGPGDAQGFGFFDGQYGMLVLSRYPILENEARTFQNFRWTEMPGNRLEDIAGPEGFYSVEEAEVLRLSSKSHWDVPVDLEACVLHLLTAHPTPPVFDGEEDRNGRRNADEIRLWADYVAGADYIVDDNGRTGGLAEGALFAIAGDYNADRLDGDGRREAIAALLASGLLTDPGAASFGGEEASRLQGGKNQSHSGAAGLDTADFGDVEAWDPGNLRVDYVLPASRLQLLDAGVFWPAEAEADRELLALADGTPVSDHHLVWADIACPAE
ncbi:MAG: endonuclease/exonuclease/phosphatase family protein [Cucumibacter sp.]